MQKLYLDSISIGKVSKKQKDQVFYNYYFKDCSEKYCIPIKDFHAPTNSLKGTKFKTISSFYIEKVKLANKFMKEFKRHLEGELKG